MLEQIHETTYHVIELPDGICYAVFEESIDLRYLENWCNNCFAGFPIVEDPSRPGQDAYLLGRMH